ncbi:Fagellar hook-basal body protein, FlgE/F/G [Moorella glycerini]|uniref:Flagellar hook protein FlgE n=1 Tax=Neomoorella stamsii TaxID=1266720 RepID=A0A9X7J3H2_9FIRM|nr:MULTISPECIES: flagellar hook-basal body complex protein [Moorella]PRR72285.1 Flagellar basal-body rod protein FlgG [Moorella stamsii]CEP68904.1 Fagellar hook-basal body protein, FlgE/F/G [Moorella glycerini]CEP69586.1 Fagellar hook-basal body protein, FlgE/F/G [Moorella glycerini]
MMRSLFSGVSGLRTHQLRMDVIADNIANVNTVGFKRSTVTFKDVFYQTLRGGSAGDATAGIGGTNPQQIGLGVALNSIDVMHTQGAASSTGNGTDLMIQGDGFFEVKDASDNVYYTRAGNFHFDSEGNLVTPDGLIVQDSSGNGINIGTNATSYSIDKYGNVYVNGTKDSQIRLVKFPNPSGLDKIGSNLYAAADGAGSAIQGVAGDTNFPNTTIIPSALEMSNVDLAQEFTDMIITERGFQANARTITVSDQMLQELVNLKR